MIIKEIFNKFPPFRYMIDNCDIHSSIAKDRLLKTQFITDTSILYNEFNKIEKIVSLLKKDGNLFNTFGAKLCRLRNIDGTIKNIYSNNILDDIELYEIKYFCFLSEEINEIYSNLSLDVVEIPNLKEVIKLLDPDNTKVPSFYVYDSYSAKLADIRKQIKAATKTDDKEKIGMLRMEEETIEDEIRAKLSQKLKPHVKFIETAIKGIVELDILLAKSQQANDMLLCKPTILQKTEISKYKSLYNPQIKEALAKRAKKYQPIDITLYKSPCLITGANMSGKTVLLKTVALAQYLTQFGFYIPAEEAQVAIVDEIMQCMDEEYDELEGLSSFAAEILRINDIIKTIKSDKNILVLIDELARTTNPTEGKKIVNATLQFLNENNTRGLITTHYSDISYKTRNLRVKGLTVDTTNIKLTIDNINDYIDYSLIETDQNDVPHEAIKIAALLNVDKDFISLCKKY